MKKRIVIALAFICAPVTFAQDRAQPAGELVSLKERLLVIEGYCTAIAFSPDGTKAVCASLKYHPSDKCLAKLWKTVLVWDLVNNKQIQVLTGHEDWVSHVAFSEDGKKVIGVVGEPLLDREKLLKTHVLTWDLGTGKLIGRASAACSAYGLSKDGKRLLTRKVVEEDGQVVGRVFVYDVNAGCKKIFSAKVDKFLTAAMSPDGSALATASFSSDKRLGLTDDIPIEVWNIASGKKEAQFEIKNAIGWESIWLLFSDDGKVLCASLRSATHCWSIPQKKSLGVFDFGMTTAISPDGRYALGSYGSNVFSLKSGKRVADLTGLDGLRCSPHWHLLGGARGTFACAACEDEIRIWEFPRDLPE